MDDDSPKQSNILRIIIAIAAGIIIAGFLTIVTIRYAKEMHLQKRFVDEYNALEPEQTEEAFKLVETFSQKYPDNTKALLIQGYLEIDAGNTETGILINEKILALDPVDSAAFNNLSWAYNRKGLYKLALHYGQLAIEYNQDGDKFHEYCNVGEAYSGLKDYENAIVNYEEAASEYNRYYRSSYLALMTPIDQDSDLQIPLAGIADSYLALEQKEKAFLAYMEYFEKFPSHYSAYSSLLDFYTEEDDWIHVEEITATYLENCQEGDETYAYSRLGYLYGEAGAYAKAAKYYLSAAQSSEYKAYYYYQAGRAYAQDGKLEEATRYLYEAMKIDEYYQTSAKFDPVFEEVYSE